MLLARSSLTSAFTVELGVPGATAAPGIGMLISLLMWWPLPFNGDVLKLDNDVCGEQLHESETLRRRFASSNLPAAAS